MYICSSLTELGALFPSVLARQRRARSPTATRRRALGPVLGCVCRESAQTHAYTHTHVYTCHVTCNRLDSNLLCAHMQPYYNLYDNISKFSALYTAIFPLWCQSVCCFSCLGGSEQACGVQDSCTGHQRPR